MNKVLKHQGWHMLFLGISLFLFWQFISYNKDIISGSLWGLNSLIWFVIALAIPIIHQIYVLIIWRLELYFKSITKLLGSNAFIIYKAGFFIFFIGRFVLLMILAVSNKNSFQIQSTLKYSLIVMFSIIAVYAFYSVFKYFGTDRAAGLDHFDTSVSKLPFVKGGIFKYTSNGMYVYAFLIFYIPGLVYESSGALLVALFSHIYIWIHYYCTELSDISEIYKSSTH